MTKTDNPMSSAPPTSDVVAQLRIAGRFYRFFLSGQVMNANAARSMRKVCGLGVGDDPTSTAVGEDEQEGQQQREYRPAYADLPSTSLGGRAFDANPAPDASPGDLDTTADRTANVSGPSEQDDQFAADRHKEQVDLPQVSRLKWNAIVDAGAFPFDDCARLMKAYRNGAARRVRALARQLPVWEWVSQIRGAGDLNLGLIVGETGDLSLYANPAKLWKRMGLAVMEDGRSHRRVKGEQTGYSPIRRTLMHNLGECLLRQNDGEARAIYDARKAYELGRDPEMKPIIAHKRALRYMEKRFLRDLWREWRRMTAVVDLRPSQEVHHAVADLQSPPQEAA